MKFSQVVKECLANSEFVREFERLFNASKPNSPIEIMIDESTGYDLKRMSLLSRKFIAFVYEVVWCRLPEEVKDLSEIVTPPPGLSLEELMKT